MPDVAHRSAPELTLLTLSGSDCASFLQGYVTADTAVFNDSWQGCAFTNLKGRVVATALARRREADVIELVISSDLVEPLQAFLAKYLMFARSTLSVSEQTVVTLLGDVAPSERWFDGAGLRLEGSQEADTLEAAAWHQARLNAGIAWVSAATSEVYLPQMLGLVELGYVSFDKGCYLGQEIVARAAHRGEVKRRLTRLAWRGATAPAEGDDVLQADKRIGSIVDASCSPTDNGSGVALAVINGELSGSVTGAATAWQATIASSSAAEKV